MGAGTWESHHAITRLMYEYADCVDRADFDGIGRIFAAGRITQPGVPGGIEGAEAVASLYRGTNRVHPDGTLRTRHLTTNVIVDIDEPADTATASSSFVVFQDTPNVRLQPIVTGRYRDRFRRVADVWRFEEREMRVEHIGDVSEHLTAETLAMIERGRIDS
jgi:3-phenylpropionate/cinnamic acid dioxygenase small subunit